MKPLKHLHILHIPEAGLVVRVKCDSEEFEWFKWIRETLKDPEAPKEATTLGLLLLASGIGQTKTGIGQTKTGIGQTKTGTGQTKTGTGQTKTGPQEQE